MSAWVDVLVIAAPGLLVLLVGSVLTCLVALAGDEVHRRCVERRQWRRLWFGSPRLDRAWLHERFAAVVAQMDEPAEGLRTSDGGDR